MLAKQIFDMTRGEDFAKDSGLRELMQVAAASVMSNIASGFERDNPKDFRSFLRISLMSCSEIRSHLYIAFDQNYIQKSAFRTTYKQSVQTTQLINALINQLYKEQESGRV